MPRQTERATRGETIITETPPNRSDPGPGGGASAPPYGYNAATLGRERRVRGGPTNMPVIGSKVRDLNDAPASKRGTRR